MEVIVGRDRWHECTTGTGWTMTIDVREAISHLYVAVEWEAEHERRSVTIGNRPTEWCASADFGNVMVLSARVAEPVMGRLEIVVGQVPWLLRWWGEPQMCNPGRATIALGASLTGPNRQPVLPNCDLTRLEAELERGDMGGALQDFAHAYLADQSRAAVEIGTKIAVQLAARPLLRCDELGLLMGALSGVRNG